VVEFYSKITDLWVELEHLDKTPLCTCSEYKCEAANKIIKRHEQVKAHQFLMGLNDDIYSSIRSQILTFDMSPSLDRIFNMVVQEGNHKSLMLGQEDRNESAAVFPVTTGEHTYDTVTKKAGCKHCGKFGHDESSCYELIGYPPG